MGRKVEIELAYEDDLPLVLDHPGNAWSYKVNLQWLADNATEEELPLILASTVALFQSGAGTINQCLETAMVWERG